MNMREKLARSIMDDMGRQNPSLDVVDDGELLGMADDYDNKFYDAYELSDAFLDALMEPTEGMCIAGCHALIAGSIFEHEASMVFQAMLKAAKDGK